MRFPRLDQSDEVRAEQKEFSFWVDLYPTLFRFSQLCSVDCGEADTARTLFWMERFGQKLSSECGRLS